MAEDARRSDRPGDSARRGHRRLLKALAIIAVSAWLGWIFIAISRSPVRGAENEAELRTRLEAALTGRDGDELGALFDPGQAGPDYARAYLDELNAAEPAGVSVRERRIRSSGGQDDVFLVVSGGGPGAVMCTAWKAAEKDGRWFLNAVPSVNQAGCRFGANAG